MSYMKDKLSENNAATEKKKQEAAKLQMVVDAKNKEEAQQQAAIDAKKQAKKQAKLDGKIDKELTKTFNRLNSDLDYAVECLEHLDGKVHQNVGGANTLKELLKNGFGLAARNLGTLTTDHIENNKAFQTYKNTMSEQGYDVEIDKVNASESLTGKKFGTTIFSSVGVTAMMSGFLPIQIIGGIFCGAGALVNIALSNADTAGFSLKLKEIQPIALLEYKPVENEIGAELLAELNQKQKQKTKIQQPIIK